MGIKTKRVVFTFDDRSLRTLEQMKEEGKYSSMAECVKESLQVNRALSGLAERGYSEMIVRNPETGQERVMVVPRFQPGYRRLP